jgi:site-specific DNA-methyltransferase (adenine-specific)
MDKPTSGIGPGLGPFQVDNIYNGDSLALMKDLPASSIDLVITDPPFAISFKANKLSYKRKLTNVLEGYADIKQEDYLDFTRKWMAQVHRVLKHRGSMYVFSGWNNLKDILIAIDEANFTVVNHIIWKYQFGVCTKYRYVTSHYHCLYVCKNIKARKFIPFPRFPPGKRGRKGHKLHYYDKEDVWEIPREYWKNKIKTPTKLPGALIRKILAYSSEEGDLVFDPFLGSGQVALISKEMGRHFLGVEIVKDYYDFAKKRLGLNDEAVSGQGSTSVER